MKRIKLVDVETLTGQPFDIPKMDATGKPTIKLDPETKKPMTDPDGKPTNEIQTVSIKTLPELIEYFILFGIPRDKYTNLDAIKVGNIYRKVKSVTNSIFEIDDDDFKWLNEKLKDDGIGVRMFTYNLPQITDALNNFERANEPAGKKGAGEASKE